MKKLFIGLMFASGLMAQQGNTVYQNVFSGTTTLGSVAIKGVGQSFHYVTAFAEDITAGSCTGTVTGGWTGRLQIEGSSDNSHYFVISQPIQLMNPGTPVVTTGAGAFPFVRLNYVRGNTGFCKITAIYSGAIQGYKITDVFNNNVRTGMLNGGLVAPATGASFGQCAIADGKVMSIYGVYLNNNSNAGTDATNVTVTIQDSTGTPVVVDQLNFGTLRGASTPIILPISARPYIGVNQYNTSNYVAPVMAVLTFGGAANLAAWIQYRCE